MVSTNVHSVFAGADSNVKSRPDQSEIAIRGAVKSPAARRIVNRYAEFQRVYVQGRFPEVGPDLAFSKGRLIMILTET